MFINDLNESIRDLNEETRDSNATTKSFIGIVCFHGKIVQKMKQISQLMDLSIFSSNFFNQGIMFLTMFQINIVSYFQQIIFSLNSLSNFHRLYRIPTTKSLFEPLSHFLWWRCTLQCFVQRDRLRRRKPKRSQLSSIKLIGTNSRREFRWWAFCWSNNRRNRSSTEENRWQTASWLHLQT